VSSHNALEVPLVAPFASFLFISTRYHERTVPDLYVNNASHSSARPYLPSSIFLLGETTMILGSGIYLYIQKG